MPEFATRLPCPVCLGLVMEKAAAGPDGKVVIDRCGRCGGTWITRKAADRLRAMPQSEAVSELVIQPRVQRVPCHDCGYLMSRGDARCEACGSEPRLNCPSCDGKMKVVAWDGLRLDVCERCEGVWFDHDELGVIWGSAIAATLDGRRDRLANAPIVGDVAADIAFNTLIFAPDLFGAGISAAGHAAGAAARGLTHLPDAIGAAPEVAGAAFEVVGEAAGGVFKAVLEVIGAIFDNL